MHSKNNLPKKARITYNLERREYFCCDGYCYFFFYLIRLVLYVGNLDEQNGPQEASGVSSAAAKMRKNSIKKQKVGHDLLPPILSESR